MVTRFRTLLIGVVAAGLASCSFSSSPHQLVQDAATAMGGADKLKSIQTISMTGGTGTRTKVGQAMTATGADQIGQLSNDSEILDLANKRAALDYDLVVGAFMQHRHEVLDRENASAKAIGIESVGGVTFATTPSGLFSWGTQNSPEWLLRRNPVSVLLTALDSTATSGPVAQEEFNGKKMNHAHAKSPDGDDVGLFFDPDTKLLGGFEIVDTETMLGDVTAQYIFSDYKDVNGIKLPFHVKIRKGDEDYSEVQFANIAVNDAKSADSFALPKELDAKAWSVASADDSFPMTLKKAANGVYQAQGFRHHSMVVEFPNYVAVVEAPYLETQTRMLAKAIAIQFPNKPIKYVAVTHFHFDHTGGVRAAAALGATILVERRHEPALRKLLDAKHTSPKDDLQTAKDSGKTVGNIETYDGKYVLKDGNQSLELIAFSGSPHVEPMVMAYVPNGHVLFQSDLWFPGTGGTGNPAAAQLLDSIKKANLTVDTMVGGHGLIGPYSELTKAIAAMK